MQPCTHSHSHTHLTPKVPFPQISIMSCSGFESKLKSEDKEYRQPLFEHTHPWQERSWISRLHKSNSGMDRGIWTGSEVVPQPLSLLLKTHLASDGFYRLRFKGQVHYPLPSLFFLSSPLPNALFPPLFHTSPIAPQNPHIGVFSRFWLFQYSTHTEPHTQT